MCIYMYIYIYKGIQVQKILSKMYACRVKIHYWQLKKF